MKNLISLVDSVLANNGATVNPAIEVMKMDPLQEMRNINDAITLIKQTRQDAEIAAKNLTAIFRFMEHAMNHLNDNVAELLKAE